jgi:hypothetical protein
MSLEIRHWHLPRPIRHRSVKPVAFRSCKSINGSLNEPSPDIFSSFVGSGNSSLQTAVVRSFVMDES